MARDTLTLAKPRWTLRRKLGIGLVLIIGLVFIGFNSVNVMLTREARRNDAALAAKALARLAMGSLIGELANHELTSERIRTMVRNLGATFARLKPEEHNLAFLLVTNTNGDVIEGFAATQLAVFPGGITYESQSQVLTEVARLGGALGGHVRTTASDITIPGRGVVGKLYVGISVARVEHDLQRDLLLSVLALLAAVAALLVYSSQALGRLVVRPLEQVVNSMRAVRDGSLNEELPVRSNDELGILSETFNFMVTGLRDREKLREAFNRYVSRQVYEKLQAGELQLAGEQREATVVFTDIRSFTSLAERMTPKEVVHLLNEYFTEMVEIVFKYDGFLNKFIGDAIMAVYNVPLEQSQPELRAVRTAIEMLQALERLNQRRQARGLFPLRIGIGINTGPVIAGNIGHEERLEYTVIGDTVNLAQRIESQTKVTGMPLLISQATYERVADAVVAEALPVVKLKGKQESVQLYAVTGLRTGRRMG